MQGNIAFRHHVRPQEGHQQINVRSPIADTFQTQEFLLHLIVRQFAQGCEIDSFFLDRLCKMPEYDVFCQAEAEAINAASVEAKRESGDNRPTLRDTLSKHAWQEASDTCSPELCAAASRNRASASKAEADRV